jgi:hypothetical protein
LERRRKKLLLLNILRKEAGEGANEGKCEVARTLLILVFMEQTPPRIRDPQPLELRSGWVVGKSQERKDEEAKNTDKFLQINFLNLK